MEITRPHLIYLILEADFREEWMAVLEEILTELLGLHRILEEIQETLLAAFKAKPQLRMV
jgi:hypothetical protein